MEQSISKVATGGSQLQKTSFTGTTASTATNVPTGPGWGTSTGAFMVNGVLYKANSDGSLSKMTFDGTAYGAVSAVNTADAWAVVHGVAMLAIDGQLGCEPTEIDTLIQFTVERVARTV